MSPDEFLKEFGHLAETEGGIEALRGAIRELAITGRLSEQDISEESAQALLARIDRERSLALEVFENPAEAATQRRKQEKQDVPSNLSTLPKGWAWATLMQLSLAVVDCHNKTAPYVASGVRLIRTTNIRAGVLNDVDSKFVSTETYERWSARCKPVPGDLLITREAPMGEACIIPEGTTICMGQRMMLVRLVRETVEARYLLCTFMSPDMMRRVQDKPVGATVKHLRVGGVETMLVPLPPLPEQKRIVEKVDQLMALCDELEAKQKEKREKAVSFNKAVLDAVVHAPDKSKLKSSWSRVQDHFEVLYELPENVKELRQLVFGLAVRGWGAETFPTAGSDHPFSVPPGWQWQEMACLTSLVTSGSRGWKAYYATSGATFIRSQDIKKDRLEFDQKAFVALPDSVEGKRTQISDGDLLVTITGANVGKCAWVERVTEESYVSQHVALVRPIDVQLGAWIHLWLIAEHGGRGLLLDRQYGDKPGLNLDNIRTLPVPIPPAGQRSEILMKVDALNALCEELGERLAQHQQHGTRLMQAVVESLVA